MHSSEKKNNLPESDSESNSTTDQLLMSKKQCQEYLGTIAESPKHIPDNEHIHTGYRINFNSLRKVLKSLFMIHNQTVNIWTHVIGFTILFYFIMEGITNEVDETHVLGRYLIANIIQPYQKCEEIEYWRYQNQHPLKLELFQLKNEEDVPMWPIMIMLVGSAFCLACSATYHLIHPISQAVYKISLNLDSAGIGISLSFGLIPLFYYSFYCNQIVGLFYILTSSIGCVAFSYCSIKYANSKNKINFFKYLTLSIYAVATLAGLIHIFINQFILIKETGFTMKPSLYFFVSSCFLSGFGSLFYFMRCPERYNPGKHDICGHSHQIWHIFVTFSMFSVYLGSLTGYEMRNHFSQCPLPNF